jgi:hypothetical protein
MGVLPFDRPQVGGAFIKSLGNGSYHAWSIVVVGREGTIDL